MKVFLDSANLKEIDEAVSWGAIDGVTTNPSLVAKEQCEFVPRLLEICRRVDGPVSMETISREAEGMVSEGRLYAKLHPNIVVKCPLTKDGLKATRQLSRDGIRVNVTLCFSANQAMLAAKAGAYFVSPFVGRLDDISQDGLQLLRDIKTIFTNYKFSTQILAASLRHPVHVLEAARIGADIATLPFSVLETLVKHPLTDAGLDRFLKDWEKLPASAKQLPSASDIPAGGSGGAGRRPEGSAGLESAARRA